MKLDVLVFSAHPDDAELSCSGTIASMVFKQKKKVGIIDLTQGELGTRGSIEVRKEEADKAKQILGLSIRKNLKLEDGFFNIDKVSIMKVIKEIRTYKPNIVITNAPEDRHPDHSKSHQLLKESIFLSGLSKIQITDDNGDTLERWKPAYMFSYIQDKYIEPDFLVDISDYMPHKINSIKAYNSQFFSTKNTKEELSTYISSKHFLDSITHRASLFGKRIGVDYAEGFLSNKTLGLSNFDNLILKAT